MRDLAGTLVGMARSHCLAGGPSLRDDERYCTVLGPGCGYLQSCCGHPATEVPRLRFPTESVGRSGPTMAAPAALYIYIYIRRAAGAEF